MSISQSVLKAEKGRELGTRGSRRLRREGKVPGVLYGLDKDPVSISVVFSELRELLTKEAGMNAIFQIEVEGDEELVMVCDYDRNPISRQIQHADFLRLDPKHKITVEVPVAMVGDDSAVVNEGGLVEQKIFEIAVEVSPLEIPSEIEADISNLTLDTNILVSNLVFPDGVESTLEPEEVVVSAAIPKEFEEPEIEPEEGAEGEEGAEDTGAEGEEGAEGDSSDSDKPDSDKDKE